MRRKYGLTEDLTTLLVSGGGFGVGPIEHLLTALLKMRTPVQIAAVCGRSEELREKLVQIAAGLPANHPVRLKVFGFTREMDELMSAADLIVGKPGGLTTSEALAKGLVMVIVNPIPGQEERNSDHLLEEGAAIRCNNLPVLPYKIDRLLGEPARFEQMRQKALSLGKPRAAYAIVDKLLEINVPYLCS